MRKEGSCLEKEIMQGTIHYMDFPDCLLLLLSISVYARCTQSRKATHGLDRQHHDVDMTPRGRVNQNDRDKWRKYVHGVAGPQIENG